MNWIQRVQNVDHRVIYALLLVVTAVPIVRPIGIPMQISPMTSAVYDFIEKLDPARDVVLLSFDYSPGAGLDAHVVPVAVANHLAQRGIKWVAICFESDGPMMANRIIGDLEKRGFRYGSNFANLGYMAGGENAIRLFALDCLTIPTDIRGNRTADLPVMQGIRTVKDFAFVIEFAMGGPEGWIRQVIDPMGVPFALGTVTVSVPSALPYYSSGQLKGLLGGLGAAAQYELLSKQPGLAVALMDAQSTGHLLIIGFIALGNIGYFLSKRKAVSSGPSKGSSR